MSGLGTLRGDEVVPGAFLLQRYERILRRACGGAHTAAFVRLTVVPAEWLECCIADDAEREYGRPKLAQTVMSLDERGVLSYAPL